MPRAVLLRGSRSSPGQVVQIEVVDQLQSQLGGEGIERIGAVEPVRTGAVDMSAAPDARGRKVPHDRRVVLEPEPQDAAAQSHGDEERPDPVRVGKDQASTGFQNAGQLVHVGVSIGDVLENPDRGDQIELLPSRLEGNTAVRAVVNPGARIGDKAFQQSRGFLNHVLSDIRSVRFEAGFGKQPDEEARAASHVERPSPWHVFHAEVDDRLEAAGPIAGVILGKVAPFLRFLVPLLTNNVHGPRDLPRSLAQYRKCGRSSR